MRYDDVQPTSPHVSTSAVRNNDEVEPDAYPDIPDVDNVLAGSHGAIYNQLMLDAQPTREQQGQKQWVMTTEFKVEIVIFSAGWPCRADFYTSSVCIREVSEQGLDAA